MISGYNEFPNDVALVFADTIKRYDFSITVAEPDAVAIANNKVQVGFSINEDSMNMTIKSMDKFYNVTDVTSMIDKKYYQQWNAEREAALRNTDRQQYYKTYLFFYRRLSDNFFLNTYVTGIIPHQNDYERMREVRNEKDMRFSIAWKAMQQLDYSDPIRQKYIAGDETWVDDIMKVIDKKGNH